jgi:hypothetical protein
MALDDFYDWTPTGMTEFIMNAGSSMAITDFDIWMMKDWWRHLAYRYVPATAVADSFSGLSASDSTLEPSTSIESITDLRRSTAVASSSTSTASLDAVVTTVTFAESTTLKTTARPTSSNVAVDKCG